MKSWSGGHTENVQCHSFNRKHFTEGTYRPSGCCLHCRTETNQHSQLRAGWSGPHRTSQEDSLSQPRALQTFLGSKLPAVPGSVVNSKEWSELLSKTSEGHQVGEGYLALTSYSHLPLMDKLLNCSCSMFYTTQLLVGFYWTTVLIQTRTCFICWCVKLKFVGICRIFKALVLILRYPGKTFSSRKRHNVFNK